MTIFNQFLVIVGMFALTFSFYRGFFFGLKRYHFNLSAYKKIKKSETFKEWLLYTRWRKDFPKGWLILYYIILGLHFFGSLACLILYWISASASWNIGDIIARVLYYFDIGVVVLLAILFWSPKESFFKYERWIKKQRGQPPKK